MPTPVVVDLGTKSVNNVTATTVGALQYPQDLPKGTLVLVMGGQERGVHQVGTDIVDGGGVSGFNVFSDATGNHYNRIASDPNEWPQNAHGSAILWYSILVNPGVSGDTLSPGPVYVQGSSGHDGLMYMHGLAILNFDDWIHLTGQANRSADPAPPPFNAGSATPFSSHVTIPSQPYPYGLYVSQSATVLLPRPPAPPIPTAPSYDTAKYEGPTDSFPVTPNQEGGVYESGLVTIPTPTPGTLASTLAPYDQYTWDANIQVWQPLFNVGGLSQQLHPLTGERYVARIDDNADLYVDRQDAATNALIDEVLVDNTGRFDKPTLTITSDGVVHVMYHEYYSNIWTVKRSADMNRSWL